MEANIVYVVTYGTDAVTVHTTEEGAYAAVQQDIEAAEAETVVYGDSEDRSLVAGWEDPEGYTWTVRRQTVEP